MSLVTIKDNFNSYHRELQLYRSSINIIKQRTLATQVSEDIKVKQVLTAQCPSNVSFQTLDRLNGMNATQIKTTLSNQFYEYNIMTSMKCLVSSLIYFPAQTYGGSSPGFRVRYWIRQLARLSAGVEGIAYAANFGEVQKIFAVKVSKKEDLIHEFFIGLHMNRLRQSIPNFAYVYSGFNCTNPYANPKALGWCWKAGSDTPSKKITTLVYENINPSVTLGKYAESATFDQWLEKFVQIILALKEAHRVLDFTHYDLVSSNVLIRDVLNTKQFYIKYASNGKNIYLLTDKIATIIDYGLSHIKVNNEHFGVWNRNMYGVNPNKSRPMYDVYKVLLSSISYSVYKRQKHFANFIPLLQFFNTTDTPRDIINKEDEVYYSLGENPLVDSKSFDDFLNYIISHYDTSKFLHSSPQLGIRTIGCNGTDICTIKPFDYDSIGFTNTFNITDLFSFQDLHLRWVNENEYVKSLQLQESFKERYPGAIKIQFTQLYQLINNLNNSIKNTEYSSIKQLNIGILSNEKSNIFPTYKKQIMTFLKYYDDYSYSRLINGAIYYGANVYNDTNIIDLSTKYKGSINKTREMLILNFIDIFKSDIQHIRNLALTKPAFEHHPMYKKWIELIELVQHVFI